jgi:hypothetical protein
VFEVPRELIMQCDYLAPPLWGWEDSVAYQLDMFPISDDLQAALERWAREWDTQSFGALAGDDPPGPEVAAHDREGVRLWRLLRAELGPGFRVGLRTLTDDPIWDDAELARLLPDGV